MIQVIRAEETWQRAGAYYVRIQAMAREYHISLRQEFDGYDTENTKYIVLTDDQFPVATCRFYPLSQSRAMIGRVVVLPEYRGQGPGKRVMQEAEKWLAELGFTTSAIESRDVAVEFYRKQGYTVESDIPIYGETFTCIPMVKKLV